MDIGPLREHESYQQHFALAAGGNRYPNTPRFQASAFASYNWTLWGWSALTTRLGVIHLGEREENSANTFQLPAYTGVDTGASYGIDANLSLDLTVHNLFDKTYYPAAQDGGSGARQISIGDPRLLRVALRYKL